MILPVGDASLISILPWGLAGTLFIVLMYILTHPEKIDAWESLIARGLSFAGDRYKRTAVSADIQSNINNFAAVMNAESGGAVPYGLRIEWTKETSKEAFIQDGQVIVRMNRYNEQPKNMVYASIAYISKGFLPHGRHYLDPKIAKAADRIVTRKLLTNRKLDDALQFYVSEVLEPELLLDTVLKGHCAALEKLEAEGLLSPIFAREIEYLGLSKYPAVATSSLIGETTDFVDFMQKVVERERGEELPGGTRFFRASMKVAIALIAKSETLAQKGIGPHLLWITSCWADGIDTVYVAARGSGRIVTARRIIEALEGTGNIKKLAETVTTTHDPTGRAVECLIVALRRKS
jgi:hypothetical protein